MYLAIVNITLLDACMHLYCYVQVVLFIVSVHASIYRDGALWWTIYVMLVSYNIYNRFGMCTFPYYYYNCKNKVKYMWAIQKDQCNKCHHTYTKQDGAGGQR